MYVYLECICQFIFSTEKRRDDMGVRSFRASRAQHSVLGSGRNAWRAVRDAFLACARVGVGREGATLGPSFLWSKKIMVLEKIYIKNNDFMLEKYYTLFWKTNY
jgi:hypothetical protein